MNLSSPAGGRLQRLAAAFALLCGLSGPAQDFRLLPNRVMIPERGEVAGYMILTASNKFSFLPPHGWKVSGSPADNKVILMTRDLVASVTLTVRAERADKPEPASSEQFRQRLEERYPEARIVRELTCYTGGNKGVGFDLEHTAKDRPSMSTRLVFVPYEGGLVEFNLTTPTRAFPSFHPAFGNLLTSFQVEPSARKK